MDLFLGITIVILIILLIYIVNSSKKRYTILLEKSLEEQQISIDILNKEKFEEYNQIIDVQKNLIMSQKNDLNALNVGINRLKEKVEKTESLKKSSEVRLGLIGENFAPLISNFPYDHKKFRFLANPCDGVYFGDSEIVFMEFKTGNAKLSKSQKNIQDIIAKGNVRFEIFRIDEVGAHLKIGSNMTQE